MIKRQIEQSIGIKKPRERGKEEEKEKAVTCLTGENGAGSVEVGGEHVGVVVSVAMVVPRCRSCRLTVALRGCAAALCYGSVSFSRRLALDYRWGGGNEGRGTRVDGACDRKATGGGGKMRRRRDGAT